MRETPEKQGSDPNPAGAPVVDGVNSDSPRISETTDVVQRSVQRFLANQCFACGRYANRSRDGREWIFPSPGGISPIDKSLASSDFAALKNDIDTARIRCYRRTSATAIGYSDEQQRRRWKIRTRCPQSREQGTRRCRRHPHATTQTRGIARDYIGCAIGNRRFSCCGAATAHRTT